MEKSSSKIVETFVTFTGVPNACNGHVVSITPSSFRQIVNSFTMKCYKIINLTSKVTNAYFKFLKHKL